MRFVRFFLVSSSCQARTFSEKHGVIEALPPVTRFYDFYGIKSKFEVICLAFKKKDIVDMLYVNNLVSFVLSTMFVVAVLPEFSLFCSCRVDLL